MVLGEIISDIGTKLRHKNQPCSKRRNAKRNGIGNAEFFCGDAGQAALELERNGVKYSAILAANDMMALGALKAVRELGYKVPDEVQIIGFDNIEFSQYCEPALSTVQQPTFEMGAKAVRLLVDLIDKNAAVQPERLIPKLLMRKTTK